ncbi:hypothetical protein MTR67_023496, partial [Solanum verrucosum]
VSSSPFAVIKHCYTNNLQQLSMSIVRHWRMEVQESWYNIRECKSKSCLIKMEFGNALHLIGVTMVGFVGYSMVGRMSSVHSYDNHRNTNRSRCITNFYIAL